MPEFASKTGTITKDTLRAQIRRFLDEDPADDDNLLDLGFTSIAAMQLVTEWKALQLDIGFPELARCATFEALWTCLKDKTSGACPDGGATPVADAGIGR